jgi:alginate O-acetyltransferase complex protein AlgI
VNSHLYTLFVVMIGWVFFRADTLTGAVAFLGAMAGFGGTSPAPFTVGFYLTPELWIALVAGAIGSVPWVPALAAREQRTGGQPLVDLLATTALLAMFVASVLQVAARTYNPFIYFRF